MATPSTRSDTTPLGASRWGFTLIELMIVVAIIAILAAIGYPSYTSYVTDANEAAAQEFLQEVGNRQEQVMMDKRQFETSLADLNMTVPDRVGDNYNVNVNADNTATPPSYEIVATPAADTIQAGEPTLRYHSDGTKEPADAWE